MANPSPIIPPAPDEPPKAKRKERDSRKPRSSSGTPPGVARKASSTRQLREALASFLAAPSLLFSAMGDHYCAYIWANRTPQMADAWVALAEKNPRVRRILEAMVTGSDVGLVVMSTAAVVVPTMAHYGAYPSGFFNPFALSQHEQADLEAMLADLDQRRGERASNGAAPPPPHSAPPEGWEVPQPIG